MNITIDVENLTLGQVEFLEDYSKLQLDEIMAYTEQQHKGSIPFRLLMALIAIGENPEDPVAGLEAARPIKLKDVTIGE